MSKELARRVFSHPRKSLQNLLQKVDFFRIKLLITVEFPLNNNRVLCKWIVTENTLLQSASKSMAVNLQAQRFRYA